MKDHKLFYITIAAVLVTVAISGCKKDDPQTPPSINEQELITTVVLRLQEDGNPNTHFDYTYKDLDGPGGNTPVFDTLRLEAGKTYNGSVLLLDESSSPADTVSNEVEEEHNVHQFFYTPSAGINTRLTVNRKDMDTNVPPLPVGLQIDIIVGAGGTAKGSLNMKLSHYDDIPKSSSPSPESDLDIDIPVSIE